MCLSVHVCVCVCVNCTCCEYQLTLYVSVVTCTRYILKTIWNNIKNSFISLCRNLKKSTLLKNKALPFSFQGHQNTVNLNIQKKEGGISNSGSYSLLNTDHCKGNGVLSFWRDLWFCPSFLLHKKLHFFPQHLLLELKLFSNKVWEISWRLIYFPNSVNKTESLPEAMHSQPSCGKGCKRSTLFPSTMDPSS